MSVISRMGGFISARIIETKNIESFNVINDTCTIIPKFGKTFIKLDIIKNGITPNISVSDEKSGQIWNINVLIELKNKSGLKILPFNRYLLILTNPLGYEFVFGTLSFPIRLTNAPILSSAASGKMGELLNFVGNQPVYPYEVAQ